MIFFLMLLLVVEGVARLPNDGYSFFYLILFDFHFITTNVRHKLLAIETYISFHVCLNGFMGLLMWVFSQNTTHLENSLV